VLLRHLGRVTRRVGWGILRTSFASQGGHRERTPGAQRRGHAALGCFGLAEAATSHHRLIWGHEAPLGSNSRPFVGLRSNTSYTLQSHFIRASFVHHSYQPISSEVNHPSPNRAFLFGEGRVGPGGASFVSSQGGHRGTQAACGDTYSGLPWSEASGTSLRWLQSDGSPMLNHHSCWTIDK